jgi:hypothetical protein
MKWTPDKPNFNIGPSKDFLLLTASKIRGEWEYTVYQIKKVWYEEEWYMGWLTGDGEEYGDLADLKADLYMTMPLFK